MCESRAELAGAKGGGSGGGGGGASRSLGMSSVAGINALSAARSLGMSLVAGTSAPVNVWRNCFSASAVEATQQPQDRIHSCTSAGCCEGILQRSQSSALGRYLDNVLYAGSAVRNSSHPAPPQGKSVPAYEKKTPPGRAGETRGITEGVRW